jgi:ATP-dependent exoDNAse (exonuclease V) alpha subunit
MKWGVYMILTNQQQDAVDRAKKWWKKRDKQTFEISGIAGAGKSTVVHILVEEFGLKSHEVLFVAYVGKAALVLTQKGNNAKTIHSAIYNPTQVPKLDENGNYIIVNNRPLMTVEFIKKESLPDDIKLIVVDEGGMVPEKLAIDILSFGIPVIVLGDNNQLDPVFGERFFLNHPDAELTEPMRQALDSPIIYLAQRAMNGKPIKTGKYGNKCYVIEKDMITDNMLVNSDVVICNRNKTREWLNNHIRQDILKIDSEIPKVGEKLMCTQNNWTRSICDDIYLINGMLGYAENVYLDTYNGRTLTIDFRPEFLKFDYFKKVKIDYQNLIAGVDMRNGKRSFYDKFEYGYAVTTWKMQGSEADKVFIYDEPYGTADFRRKVLYTAITRAKEFLIIAV